MMSFFAKFFTQKQKSDWELFVDQTQKIATEITSCWNFLDRKVSLYTNYYLPSTLATKIQKLFNATPFIALTLFTPSILTLPLAGASYLVERNFGPFSDTIYDNMYNGLTVGTGLLCGAHAIGFTASFSANRLLATIVYGIGCKIFSAKASIV